MDTYRSNTVFHPRYSYSDGDLVLSSCDATLFRVHSLFLKIASGYFRQILENPPDATAYIDDPILLTEDGNTISVLLDVIYPLETPPAIRNLDVAWAVTKAADKYDMPRALTTVRSVVINDPLRSNAIGLYALACRWKWDDVVKLAAESTVLANLSDKLYCKDLELLSSRDLVKLHQYHQRRFEEIREGLYEFFGLQRVVELVPTIHPDELADYAVWTCKCEKKSLTVPVLHSSYMAMVDAVRGAFDRAESFNLLKKSKFWAEKGQWFWAQSCRDCGDSYVKMEDVTNAMQILLDNINDLVLWKCQCLDPFSGVSAAES